tara:strand:+ start:83998 stop:86703 length:2706 start_codon:yes stop_codon:yes gene_type:complete
MSAEISKFRKQIIHKEEGQLSIFMGMTLLVIVSFLAFIINVGLFVKAKINLQNAVDAAAYSGASVQARQLTNIAWLNWEMRNTYKEWMFKYYVLGQKKLESTKLDGGGNVPTALNRPKMNFRLRPFYEPTQSGYDPTIFDYYNVPSICIDYGSSHPICHIASVPGLPRFNTVGMPSISEHHESFLNSLVSTKSDACSSRSNVNMGTAMLWAYGTRNSALFSDVPDIASSRPGAWTESLELALRMRNLEMIMNLPPISEPICLQPSSVACIPASELDDKAPSVPLYERPIKSFWSAFRNLGGGAYKEDISDPFVQSFRLTELKPKPLNVDPNSLSGFLIPPSAGTIGEEGSTPFEKHYVDLQVYPMNLVTFYTTFVTTTGEFKNEGVSSESDCAGVKTALPVPGYILGFTKNPEVLTYYPVKGEAEFVGLFFPFTETSGIKLTAYAAAKPFGGRIGPKLFQIEGETVIKPRSEAEKRLTVPYFSAIDTAPVATAGGGIKAGFPIPTTVDFWASASKLTIGGNPTTGEDIGYGIPNLIYDFESISDIQGLGYNYATDISILAKAASDTMAYAAVQEDQGLYDIKQFEMFAANQVIGGGSVLRGRDVLQSIYNVRKPTRYEAMNYLIPVLGTGDSNPVDWDTQGYAQEVLRDPQTDTPFYELYAPLFGENLLYREITEFTNIIEGYLNANETQITKYLDALKEVREQILTESASSTRGGDSYQAAADSIYKLPLNVDFPETDPQCEKLSMAQKFNTFFFGTSVGCGITPLRIKLTEYYNNQANNNGRYKDFYMAPYTVNPELSESDLMTGFAPGPRQGANDDGTWDKPFGSSATQLAKRNFYSTKFFPMHRIVEGGELPYENPGIFFESKTGSSFLQPAEDFLNIPQVNKLSADQLSEFDTLDF